MGLIPLLLRWETRTGHEGIEEVLVAGEPERIAMKQRSVEGIYIDDSTWGQLESTAKHVRLTAREINAIKKQITVMHDIGVLEIPFPLSLHVSSITLPFEFCVPSAYKVDRLDLWFQDL